MFCSGRRLIQALRKPWFGHPDRIDTSAGIFELEEVYCAVQCGTIRMLIADNSGEQELPLLTFQLNHIRGEISKDPGSLVCWFPCSIIVHHPDVPFLFFFFLP